MVSAILIMGATVPVCQAAMVDHIEPCQPATSTSHNSDGKSCANQAKAGHLSTIKRQRQNNEPRTAWFLGFCAFVVLLPLNRKLIGELLHSPDY